jgi:hypothetical protein
MKVVFTYFEKKETKSNEVLHIDEEKVTREVKEFECDNCRVFESIAVLTGVKGCTAKASRFPLFKVERMDTYE